MIVRSILSLINVNTKTENILWTYLIAVHVDKKDTLHWWAADEMVAVCSVLLCWGSPWQFLLMKSWGFHNNPQILLYNSRLFPGSKWAFGGVMTRNSMHDWLVYSKRKSIVPYLTIIFAFFCYLWPGWAVHYWQKWWKINNIGSFSPNKINKDK